MESRVFYVPPMRSIFIDEVWFLPHVDDAGLTFILNHMKNNRFRTP